MARLLAPVVVVGALMTSTMTPAMAAGCFQAGCDGKGPVSTNCDNDAVHLTTATRQGAYGNANAELKYSSACKAFWTRGHSLNSGQDQGTPHPPGSYFDIEIIKRRTSDNALLYRHRITIWNDTGVYDWTNMAGWKSGTKIRACVHLSGNSDCTSWYIHA